jgi:hypothetical protein
MPRIRPYAAASDALLAWVAAAIAARLIASRQACKADFDANLVESAVGALEDIGAQAVRARQ